LATSPTLAPRPARVDLDAEPAHPVPAPAPALAAEGTRLLYERYHERIFGYCLYHLGSREEAEDATQTTFLWAFRGLRRGVIPRAEDSWLFTIAKNACRARHRSRGRKRQREVVSDPQLLADISPAPSRQHDELIGLQEALGRMPELQRRAILLREWRGLSYREIAEELDLSGAAVETLIFRARRSLAALLDGKQAPKRARRFAFDFGSAGLTLKTALGGTSAKLAAGLAAAVVMATAVGGSVERPLPQPKSTRSVLISQPLAKSVTRVTPSVTSSKIRTQAPEKEKRPDDAAPSAPSPANQVEGPPSAGQKVEDTVGALPLPPSVTDALPLETATDLVDSTAQDLGKAVDDALTAVPDVP
jgi:RNA polymerase sigma factor (sigma-70 family)